MVSFGTEAGLYQALGISTVVCGPGSIEQAHKADEFIAEEQMGQCLAMLERLARRLHPEVGEDLAQRRAAGGAAVLLGLDLLQLGVGRARRGDRAAVVGRGGFAGHDAAASVTRCRVASRRPASRSRRSHEIREYRAFTRSSIVMPYSS